MEMVDLNKATKYKNAYYISSLRYLHLNSRMYEAGLRYKEDLEKGAFERLNTLFTASCKLYLDASRKVGISFENDPALTDCEKERLFVISSVYDRTGDKGPNMDIEKGLEFDEKIKQAETLLSGWASLHFAVDSLTGFDRAVIEKSIDDIETRIREILDSCEDVVGKDADITHAWQFVRLIDNNLK